MSRRYHNILFPIEPNLNEEYGYVEMEDLLQIRRTLEDVLADIPGVIVEGSGTWLNTKSKHGVFDIDISITRSVSIDSLKQRLAQFAKRYHIKQLQI